MGNDAKQASRMRDLAVYQAAKPRAMHGILEHALGTHLPSTSSLICCCNRERELRRLAYIVPSRRGTTMLNWASTPTYRCTQSLVEGLGGLQVYQIRTPPIRGYLGGSA
jgi:hypothetical protein